MARTKSAGGVVALLVVVLLSATPAHAAGAPPEMKVACAKTSTGVMRYVVRAKRCHRPAERVVRFGVATPVSACAHRGGYVYLVARKSDCRRPAHRPSLALTLPSRREHGFCAHDRTGRLRSTEHAPYPAPRPHQFTHPCHPDEHRILLPVANRRPDAVDDSATAQAGSAKSIAVLGNDTDPDGDRLTVASADRGSAKGAVTIATDRRSVIYDPAGHFTALGAGAQATDTFTYRAGDGRRSDGAKVTVTVQGVDDAPQPAADTGNTTEDAVVTLAVLGNDTDPDHGDVLSVTAVDTAGTAAAVTINPDGTVRYDPTGRLDQLAAGEQRVDRFGYTVSDGHGGSAGATVSVTVTGVDDAAVVSASAGSAAYTEGDPATAVDGGLTISDPDDVNLTGARVRISAGSENGDELDFTDQSGISGSYNAGTGVLLLSGGSSVADYQTALRSVGYRHTGDAPAASRTIEFRADDGDGLGPAAMRDVDVTGVNDAPAITTSAGAVGYTEGDAATAVDPGLVLTDPDSQITAATVQITGNHATPQDILALPAQPNITAAYDGATGTLTLSGTDSAADYQAALEAVTYRNTSNNPSTATRTVTFIASDASSSSAPATRDIDVSTSDNAPDIDNSAGSLSYTENDPATAIDTTIGITDPDSANLTGATVQITGAYVQGEDVLDLPAQPVVTGAFDVSTGQLTLSGTATVAAYETALEAVRYVNTSDNPSTAPRTVTYAARDMTGFGVADTHGVTVTAVDDVPVSVNDDATVSEDSGANAVDVLGNDTDVDGGPKSIASVTNGSNGAVAVTGGGTGLTYTPNADYCNNPPGTTLDTFTYTLDGGSVGTVSVTVDCVDDPPVAVDDDATVGEDSSANAVDVLANDTDIDGGSKTVASITQPANGTVVITGGGTGLTYVPNADYCNDPPGTTLDTFTYALDGGSVATVTMTVTCGDDGPAAVDDSATVDEDSGANAITVLTNDTDVDGGTKSVASVTQPANGTVVITGGGTGLTYAPNANFCNSLSGGVADTFTYALNGGSTATVSMTVTCQPDDPNVTASGGNLAYTENDPATRIDTALTLVDPDPDARIASATVEITANYASAQDVLALSGSHPGISAALAGDTLTLTGDATAAAYQAALRDVTYANSSEDPSTPTRTVTFTVTDDTAATDSATKGIAVTGVDDAPVGANDSATVLEDALATAVDVLTNDTDIDGGLASVTSVSQPANGTVVITGGGTGLTYEPDPNYCNNPPGTTPDTFTYTLNGGSTATVSIEVTCVNDAPTAADDTLASGAIGNTALAVDAPGDGPQTVSGPKKSITGDILANDADVDGPDPVALVPGTFASNDGGSVVIESDGDFVFTPAAGTSCSDTADFFDYTITDGNPGTPGEDTGRVDVTIGNCVWYVDNNGPGDAGTSTAPFDTLAQAQTASATGNSIFVFDGDDTPTGLSTGIDLKSGQRLVGEAADLLVGGDQLHTADPAKRPTITDTNADVVALAAGNTVRGVQLDADGTGSGIAGAAGDAGGTIDDVRIIDTGTAGTEPGLELNGTSGTFDISRLTVDNTAATGATSGSVGVRLLNAGTVNFASAGTISIATAGAKGLDAQGTTMGAGSVFDDITVSGSGSGGVSLANATGSTTFGDGIGSDLALTTTSGSAPAFQLSNAGTVVVPPGGTANAVATGGPAVDVSGSGTSSASLAFDQVASTNSANDGINLDFNALIAGSFSATSGSITGAAGISFDLDGGSGSVSYPGALNNGTGQAAEVTRRSGGSVTLSGAIADTADAGGGILLSNNSGGTTTFSNGSITINTLTAGSAPQNDAVVMDTSDGHTLTFTGGGLDIDSTGNGLEATSSGALGVTGSGNSINSVSGAALTVTNTDIAAGGLNFRRIDAGNNTAAPDPANGIVLTNTANAAGLTVAGNGSVANGGNGSGGTIQRTGSHAVALADTNNVSLNNVTIDAPAGSGVRATGTTGSGAGVTDFSFTNGTIQNAGDAGGVATDNAISFNNEAGANTKNVDGTLTLTNNQLLGNFGGGLTVAQYDGTISNANVSTNQITQATSDSIEAGGIQFSLEGTASTASGLTKGTFDDNTITNARDNGIVFGGGNTTSAGAPITTLGVPSGSPGNGTNIVTISNNQIVGDPANKMNTDGILAGGAGRAQANVQIINNGAPPDQPIANLKGQAIGVGAAGTMNATFLVRGNIVAPGNILGSDGIGVNIDKRTLADSSVSSAPTVNVEVSNNTVSAFTGYGIQVLHRNTNGTANAKILNNTVNASPGSFDSIHATTGSSVDPTFNPTSCYQIIGNTAAQGPDDGFGNAASGITLAKRSTSPTTYKFGIVGLSPSPATPAQTESYVGGLNPGSAVGAGFYAGKPVDASVGDNFTSCTLPF